MIAITEQTVVLCPQCLHEIILISWCWGAKICCDKCSYVFEPHAGQGWEMKG